MNVFNPDIKMNKTTLKDSASFGNNHTNQIEIYLYSISKDNTYYVINGIENIDKF